jgi:uncharacterized membrane protein
MDFWIALHLATILPAFLIGTWLIFFSFKGARWHRLLGSLYVVLMAITVVSVIFVREIDPGRLSWIHYVFVPLAVVSLVLAIWGARTHNVRRHKFSMIGLYIGIIGAGTAALLPGRFLMRTMFG